MRRALELAERGVGTVEPNPPVGAVVVGPDLLMLGEGRHERFGGPHAEVNALRAAGEAARGATLFVTLEPCNHQGRTPPCTTAIEQSGISRVVVATADPAKIKGMEYSKEAKIPPGSKALVKPHTEWRLLKAADPAGNWTSPDFDDSEWATGEAGFGFGDGDDRTVLNDMRGNYQRIYIRATFDGRATADADKLILMMNFDDAFIAYLNGKEILRANIGEGSGATASNINSHEAEGYEPLEIKNFRTLLDRKSVV